MFKKILIANRGEIACRVIKTARKMGIATVAVYSEADRNALHVQLADEAVLIGPAASAESYLVIDNILDAIRQTGADAVHPGYGFLSENKEFPTALKAAGVTFIGPEPHAMMAMGDKIESKKLALKAGVSTVPGHTEAVLNPDDAVKIANQIGYPVMLKASAGGGGKGMRVAWNDNECREGLERSTNEARSSFGDARVFVEKFIEQPHHIEIQIIADTHGNTIFLGERECSIQRRHQKVIEEAPSPFLDERTREAMGVQAVSLAAAVDYVSAGTVEFIVDKDRNFYFLEMNTRLQVEHPVTEYITGLDLVELMIRVAAGETLPFTQEQVKLSGWAVEARVYAEDPFRNFLPSTGRLVNYLPPTESNTVRVDTGVFEGGEISIYYDPMIAKLITFGPDRKTAVSNLSKALDAYYIRGVRHNIAFLAALAAHPRFLGGDLTTNFIADEYPDGFHGQDLPVKDSNLLVAVSVAIHRAYQERASLISGQVAGHERQVGHDWSVILQGTDYQVHVNPTSTGYNLQINDESCQLLTEWQLGTPLFHAEFDGRPICVQVERNGIYYRLTHGGSEVDVLVLRPSVRALQAFMPRKEPPDTSNLLLSPMPGLLVSVAVSVGDEVKSGEELAVVEAMKMENVLRAEKDGKIGTIRASAGDSLMVDQIILEFE